MADPLNWHEVSDRLPEEGERVLVCNAAREWTTKWHPALMLESAPCPVTHWAKVERPYPPTEPDRVKDNPGGWQRNRGRV